MSQARWHFSHEFNCYRTWLFGLGCVDKEDRLCLANVFRQFRGQLVDGLDPNGWIVHSISQCLGDVPGDPIVRAHVAMMTSALLQNGVEHLDTVRAGMVHWMEEHEYESINQMRGSVSQKNVPDPAAYERANYMRVLSSYTLRPPRRQMASD